MLKKCFGIVSWLPDNKIDRDQRETRLNNLFKQLSDLWPEIDILIIAQNWKTFKPIKTNNKQIIKNYSKLGILKARQILREEFLNMNYDYIIMFDDDAVIETQNDAHIKYIEEIDKHPYGFCFIKGENHWKGKYNPYKAAQFNLCAISRYIYEKEPLVDIDPQKNEGFEDCIYASLLHYKYAKYEFSCPENITHIQLSMAIPSTWSKTCKWATMFENTEYLNKLIMEQNDLPDNYKSLLKKLKTDKEKSEKKKATTLEEAGLSYVEEWFW